MLRNYITTAIRFLLRFKTYALINIGGFTAGLTITIFILLWIAAELRVDQFQGDRVYRVMNNYTYADGNITTGFLTQGPLAAAVMDEIPEAETAVRLSRPLEALIQAENLSFKETGHYADPGFFPLLNFDIAQGNGTNPLPHAGAIAISESLAKKLFPASNAIGKTIRVDRLHDLTVTAIFKEVPSYSTLQFTYILPFALYEKQFEWLGAWNNNSIFTYVKLKESASVAAANQKLNGIFRRHCSTCENSSFLFRSADLYLYGRFENGTSAGGRIEYVRLFAFAALVILVMSCVNFTVLATAQATSRMREVGVRKVAGAGRGNLARQFLSESVLLSLTSLALAGTIVYITAPLFAEITGQQISLAPDSSLPFYFVCIAVATGVLAGSYPAFYLASRKPAQILRGNTGAGSRLGRLPRALVVAQLVLSAILIMGSFVVHEQVAYIRSKDLGFSKEDIVVLNLSDSLASNPAPFTAAALSIPGVESVGLANHQPFSITRFWNTVSWPGKRVDDLLSFYVITCDEGFIPTLGIELLEGRNFAPGEQDAEGYIVNETAASMMGLTNAVGTAINARGSEGRIIGVVRDFHNGHLRGEINPLLMVYSPSNRLAFARLDPASTGNALEGLRNVAAKMDPGYPFEYSFLKDAFNRQYRSEETTENLSLFFAAVATFISSIGLFGIALFVAARRSKEISIRKVMGATVRTIILLLTKQFATLVGIALLIGLPLAYYIMSEWLTNYTFRVHIGWPPLLTTAAVSLVVALVTISVQTIRAAFTNPVDMLRSE